MDKRSAKISEGLALGVHKRRHCVEGASSICIEHRANNSYLGPKQNTAATAPARSSFCLGLLYLVLLVSSVPTHTRTYTSTSLRSSPSSSSQARGLCRSLSIYKTEDNPPILTSPPLCLSDQLTYTHIHTRSLVLLMLPCLYYVSFLLLLQVPSRWPLLNKGCNALLRVCLGHVIGHHIVRHVVRPRNRRLLHLGIK